MIARLPPPAMSQLLATAVLILRPSYQMDIAGPAGYDHTGKPVYTSIHEGA